VTLSSTTENPDREQAGSTSAPAVSIVVPCYDGGRFLDGLMHSLAHQSFRDFEIVIVDDGSRDAETLRKLAALRGVARVIRQENAGPSAARNTGIRAARADILFVLDCDDTIEPDFLAETVPLLKASPADVGMVFSDLRLTGGGSDTLPRYFNRFDLLFTNTLSAGLVMRREAWRAAGGYDEAMRDGYEDWDFSLRLVRAGFRGVTVARPLYRYHIAAASEASRSTDVDSKKLYGALWRYIRKQHPESYSLGGILHAWCQSRDGTGRVPLWKGLTAYLMAQCLPDTVFNDVIALLHRRHHAGRPGCVPHRPGPPGAPRPATQS
jgi:glycosyltransferase involved in cell wall biosynthesis